MERGAEGTVAHRSLLARPCSPRGSGSEGNAAPELRPGVALPGNEHVALCGGATGAMPSVPSPPPAQQRPLRRVPRSRRATPRRRQRYHTGRLASKDQRPGRRTSRHRADARTSLPLLGRRPSRARGFRGQCQDGRAGTADHRRHTPFPQPGHQLGGAWHRRRAVVLVQPVRRRGEQQCRRDGEGVRQEGCARGVEHGIGVRHRRREQAAYLRGGRPKGRDEGDRREIGVGLEPDRERAAVVPHPGEGDPAQQAGRDVVGMPFEVGAPARGRRRRPGPAPHRPPVRAPRRRPPRWPPRRSRAPRLGDAVGADHLQPGRLLPHAVEGGPQRAYDEVGAVARQPRRHPSPVMSSDSPAGVTRTVTSS